MKALTLTQPWASLVAIGAKRIETRSWPTNYRGPLAIHAAKGFPKWAQRCVTDNWEFFTAFAPEHAAALRRAGVTLVPSEPGHAVLRTLPQGAVVATCTLIDCVCMEEFRYGPEGNSIGIGKWTEMLAERPQERHFGDYQVGRYAWILEGVEMLRENPIPAKGALGLWEWERP